MGGNPVNFSVLPWQSPKFAKNFVPEYSRCFFYNKYGLFFAWRNNESLVFTFRGGTASLSSHTTLQSQIIFSKETILDILLLDHIIYFVSPSGFFQVLNSTERMHSSDVLKHLESCKTFSLNAAFRLSSVKKILSVTTISNSSRHNRFAVITCSHDNGTLNAEFYSVAQKSSSKIESSLEFLSNISSDNNPLKTDKCACHFLTQSQAANLFSDCKDADVLLVGLRSGQLFCVPFLMSGQKLGIRPSPRLIFQSLWPIIGLTCSPDGSYIFVFLEGGTVLKISPISNQSRDLNAISLSYSSFTLSHPVKCFSPLTYDQLVVSDGFDASLIHIIPQEHTQVNVISVKGITAMSPILQDNLIIASTSHSEFYLLNPASTPYTQEQTHLPWSGCNLDRSLKLVQDMEAQTAILTELRSKLEEEDCLIKALSSVSRSALMDKLFTLNIKVLSRHEELIGGSEEATDFDYNDFTKNTYQNFLISIQVKNNSPENFSSSLWKMGLEFRSSDGLAATRNISFTRTFSRDFPISTKFNIPFTIEISSLPLEVKGYLLAEIKDNERSEWLKINLGTTVLDVSHFVSVFSQAPQTSDSEVHDIADYVNQIYSPVSDSISQSEELHEKSFVSCVVPVPEEFRHHNTIVEKILCNCIHSNGDAKEKYFSNQSDKTVMWLKFLHKTLTLVFRKSCSSITVTSAHLDFFHCFKLHLTSIFKEDSKSDCNTEHDVACIKAKNLNAVLETLSLEEALDPKQLLGIYQDLRNNVSPHMY